jgi:hypothetical protein
MRALVTILAWALLLASIALVMLYRAPSADPDATHFRRFRVYPLARPVEFAVEPAERAVKLLTWLRGPAPWAQDARSLRTYALRVRLFDASGREQWASTQWIASRPGLVEEADGRIVPTARLAGEEARAGESLGRDTLTELPLLGQVPRGGTLRVEAAWLPAGHQLLVGGWRLGTRSASAQLRALRPEAEEAWQERVARWSPLPWRALPARWRGAMVRDRWDRLGALPEAGQDTVDTVEIEAAFAPLSLDERAVMGIAVPPGGAAAWNLRAGTRLQIAILELDGRPGPPVDAQLRLVHPDGRVELRALPAVSSVGPLHVDEPQVSVHVALAPNEARPRLLRAFALGAGGGPWGDGGVEWDAARGARQVGVDLRAIDLVRVGGTAGPARFSVRPGERMRLGFRERLQHADLPGFGPRVPEGRGAAVSLRGLDANGADVEAWSFQLDPLPSAFERYVMEDDPGSARVAEPERWHLVVPDEVTTLEIGADALVDVELEALREPAGPRVGLPAYAPPDALDEAGAALAAGALDPSRPLPATARSRYVPSARSPWERRAPDEVDALVEQRRIVRIDAQVRLEPTWGAERAPSPVATPRDDRERAPEHSLRLGRVVERLAEPDWDGVAGPGARTRLGPQPTALRVPPDGRLDVELRVPPAEVGRTLALRLGDRAETRLVAASGGTLRFVDLPAGTLPVSLRGAEGLFLARAAGARLWQSREVVRLDPGEALEVPVDALPGALSLYTYGAAATLAWQVLDADAIEPGLYPRIGARAGTHRPVATGRRAEALSFAGPALPVHLPLRIALDADLGAEAGVVRIERIDAGGPLFVRATATWAPPPRSEARSLTVGGAR